MCVCVLPKLGFKSYSLRLLGPFPVCASTVWDNHKMNDLAIQKGGREGEMKGREDEIKKGCQKML